LVEDKKLTMRLKVLDVGGEVVNSKGKELDNLINVVKFVEGREFVDIMSVQHVQIVNSIIPNLTFQRR
jgi:hypothetical protein